MSLLFQTLNVGGITLKNRVVMSPMITNLGTPQGYPSDSLISYFRERSDVGLLITEYTYVNSVDSRGSANQLGLYDDTLVPKFYRLTKAVHDAGTRIFTQLVHVGRKTRRPLINSTPIAPSPIKLMDEVREMTKEDIDRVIEDFAQASRRAQSAGFDGIELHGAHGYLIAQFLSPVTNKRRDKYSDGVVFVQELIKRIREVVSLPLGMRLSVTEFDDGITPEMARKIVDRLDLDYVHLSAGRDGPLGSSMPFYYREPAFLEEVKKFGRPGIPLFVVGSVKTEKDAEKVLELADAVVIGRQLLAEPDWVRKVRFNLPVRPCIRCNQLCRGFLFREVGCDVNPRLGWESIPLPSGRGEVDVIGGGIAGLEASITLAKRGFSVSLYEMEDDLGGEFRFFMDPWKKREFHELIDYYKAEIERLGVIVHLNSKRDVTENSLDMTSSPKSPPFVEYSGKRILIDSNVYAYQDYAFVWSERNDVYITENSLRELDQTRRHLLTSEYSKIGVKVISQKVDADVIISERRRDQPTIGKAIGRGYWAGVLYKQAP
ncbi:NADH oxidase [Sulfolobales archaeon HS-7]|nr:NADH oxidase [Sulfolobales archaeon HS-7]